MGLPLLFTSPEIDTVSTVVKKWRPAKLSSEREYRDALYLFLHEALPKAQVRKEWTLGTTTADIYVDFSRRFFGGDNVVVELKAHLTRQNDLNRLRGQLVEYLEVWKTDTLLVLLRGGCVAQPRSDPPCAADA